jgi:UDP-N-acetylmuramate dehydrogenase
MKRIRRNVPLAKKTTFNIGGTAAYYCEADNEKELKDAVRYAKKEKLPIFILGGGSNVLLDDSGFDGMVIRLTGKGIKVEKEGKTTVTLRVSSGEVWDDLVKFAVKKNYQGIESLSGIPGLVGAAPVQNIGAYGQELKDVFTKLRAYDQKMDKMRVFKREDCKFGYRDSTFKNGANKGRYIILSVTLVLNKGKEPEVIYNTLRDYLRKKKIIKPLVSDVRMAVLDLRKKKLEDPKSICNAGSFFKNPIVDTKTFKLLKVKNPDMPFFELKGGKYKLFAGWLIEKAGWKGKKHGNASVSSKNALVLTNTKGKATFSEIHSLSNMIIEDIKEKYSVVLEPEVQVVGGK